MMLSRLSRGPAAQALRLIIKKSISYAISDAAVCRYSGIIQTGRPGRLLRPAGISKPVRAVTQTPLLRTMNSTANDMYTLSCARDAATAFE